MSEPAFSKKMIDGIYIPAGLLVVGTVIVKREWTPFAVLLALILGAIKAYGMRKHIPSALPSVARAHNSGNSILTASPFP